MVVIFGDDKMESILKDVAVPRHKTLIIQDHSRSKEQTKVIIRGQPLRVTTDGDISTVETIVSTIELKRALKSL